MFEKAEFDAKTIWPWIGFGGAASQTKASPKQEDVDLLGVLISIN